MAFQWSDRMRSLSPKFHRMVLVIALALVCAGNAAAQQKGELARATALDQEMHQLYGQGRYADAIPFAREVLAIRENALGPEHPDVAQSLNNLAELYYTQGR